jgi:TetR/AcrR family transcriptional regulator, cholesterol catabolism regulator
MSTLASAKRETQRTVPDVSDLPQYQIERRQRIIEVTLDLLLEREGKVEVRDVVEAAGVSLASVYRYFGSKEVLFSAALLFWRSLQDPLVGRAIRASDTDANRMRAVIHSYINLYVKAPQMWDLSIATRSTTHPDIVALRRAEDPRIWTQLLSTMRGISDEDARAIAMMLVAVLAWNMAQWRAGEMSIDEVREAIDQAIRLTLDVHRGGSRSPTPPRAPAKVPARRKAEAAPGKPRSK